MGSYEQLLEKEILSAASISEILSIRARMSPEDLAYLFMPNGEDVAESITFEQLDLEAKKAAVFIRQYANPGDRVVLLFPSGIEFVKAFYGCIYAGVTAVPSSLPSLNHAAGRILAIMEDCSPALVLASNTDVTRLNSKLEQSEAANFPKIKGFDTAQCDKGVELATFADKQPVFLQYTSGSTSSPKGVCVTMSALMSNCDMVAKSLEYERKSRVVSWLPIFHDMGLISSVLLPVYSGARAYLMPPAAFVQQPLRWLKAIEKYKGSIVGSPDFGYRLCVDKIAEHERAELNLSSLKTVFNGAEPIQPETLAQFSEKFVQTGFDLSRFYPVYGLAETVVFVSGIQYEPKCLLSVDANLLNQGTVKEVSSEAVGSMPLSASGSIHYGDQQVCIVHPETKQLAKADSVGEVWVSGSHVADGYWQNLEATTETFKASIADGEAEKTFLRTGDLGFLKGDLLFICGRLKDLIIIRGANYYPQDIEYALEKSHADIRSLGFCAAFSVEESGAANSKLVVVVEVERTSMRKFNPQKVGEVAASAVAKDVGITPDEIVFIRFNNIPRTTSGKIQRQKTKTLYLKNELKVCGVWSRPIVSKISKIERNTGKSIPKYENEIKQWLHHRMGIAIDSIENDRNFSVYGVDSIMAAELAITLEKRCGVPVEAEMVFENPTVESLLQALPLTQIVSNSDCVLKNKPEDDTDGIVENRPVVNLPIADKQQSQARASEHKSNGTVALPRFVEKNAVKPKPKTQSHQPLTNSFVLADFKPWRSEKLYNQEDSLRYTAWLMAISECYRESVDFETEAEKIYQRCIQLVERYGISPNYISKRQMNVFPEKITAAQGDVKPMLPVTHQNIESDFRGMLLEDRMGLYNDFSIKVMQDWYRNDVEAPSDIVHVTCSGYLSPSPAQRLVASKNWYDSRVTHCYHMGCYAAFPGLRLATGLRGMSQNLMNDSDRVDVLHTEFLSAHLDMTKTDPGHIIDMTLFADGFMRYSVYGAEEFQAQSREGLKLLASHEVIIPDSADEMTWIPGSHQFGMYLSSKVPVYIRDAIIEFVDKLCANAGFNFEDKKSEIVFAVHPGGPKILDHIRDALQIFDKQIDYGRKVLKAYGNMSSATVLHIWKNILEDDAVSKGTLIVSMAFGPGLTATGCVLQKI